MIIFDNLDVERTLIAGITEKQETMHKSQCRVSILSHWNPKKP